MKIKDLQTGQGDVNLELEVTDKAEPREFEKYGRQLRVCSVDVTDGEETIVLSLWNDDVDRVNKGDKIKIEKGYVSEFQGRKQLSAGKFGKITVLDSKNGNKEEKVEEAPGEVAF